jgi:NAD(P)-dependent dehydrogenase (short-subunit alcohol dehydrogenase family)
MTRLAGKHAIVVGAARGIGRAIATAFQGEGATVGCLDRNVTAIESLKAGLGERATAGFVDVRDPESVRPAFDSLVDAWGQLDVLVNCAALVTPRRTIEALPLAVWNDTLAVNLTGMLLTCRAAIPVMRRSGGGSIVNLASVLGSVAREGAADYCATKAAVIALSKVLALDHAADGIRVNTLSPGPVWTERLVERYGDRARAEAVAADVVPLRRLAAPEEVARAAVFLASDDSSYTTGTDMLVDGGQHAR